MSTRTPPITDDEIAWEIAEMGRRNAEAVRRASRKPHPWDEWDVSVPADESEPPQEAPA